MYDGNIVGNEADISADEPEGVAMQVFEGGRLFRSGQQAYAASRPSETELQALIGRLRENNEALRRLNSALNENSLLAWPDLCIGATG